MIAKLKTLEKVVITLVVMVNVMQVINTRVKTLKVEIGNFLIKLMGRIELRARVRSLLKVKVYYDYTIAKN